MVLVYLLGAQAPLEIVMGKLVSSTINTNFQVKHGSYIISFKEGVYQQLHQVYRESLRQEFVVCLQGKKEGMEYTITDLTLPKVFSSSVFHVSYQGCDTTSLITLHSHPYQRCIFSQQDIASYRAIKQTNPEAMIGVMCTPQRFTFYRE